MTALFRAAARIAIVAGLAGCATARVNQADEEARIRELSQQWMRASQAKDAAASAAFWAPDALLFVANDAPAVGRDAIRAKYVELYGMPELSFTWSPTSIRVARSGELATEIGTYRMSYRAPTGPAEDEGNYVTTWRKVDGEWKVATDIAASSRPLPSVTPINVTLVEGEDMVTRASAGLEWIDTPAPGFPGGRKMAILHGDPARAGDFIIRIKLPDGYEMPVHWQSRAEHFTVLSGTFLLGTGPRFDRGALKPHGPGDFVFVPARTPHFGVARGETIIQVQGMGPVESRLGAP